MAGDEGPNATVTTPEPAAADHGITRREALYNALVAIGVVPGMTLFVAYALRYLVPPPTKRMQEVMVGFSTDFGPGEVREYELWGTRLVVLRRGETLQAFGTRCSHLGCFVQWMPQLELPGETERGGFYCPCHSARFRPDGSVHSGPPPEGLPRFEVAERDGLVFVAMPVYGETDGEV